MGVGSLIRMLTSLAPFVVFPMQWRPCPQLQRTDAYAGMKTNEEREQTLNQLLTEMDGFTPDIGVVFMAATNRADLLDPALLRAGRFDWKVRLLRPDTQARFEILQVPGKSGEQL
jgi:ATP-dependent Zn protease